MQPYAPLDVLKPLARDIWTVDGPAVRLYGLPFPTRMTVIRLASGALMLHSPTRPTEPLVQAVCALGRVEHLIAPNWIHYVSIGAWHARFPEALAWSAPGVRERAAAHRVQIGWNRELGPVPPPDWAGEVDQMLVEGSKVHREVVFLHRASATLILTDLIENFDPAGLAWWARPLLRLAGVVAPDGRAPLDMRMTFRRGMPQVRDAVQRMIAWAPRHIVLAHGRLPQGDAVAELKRSFAWALNG